MLKAFAIKDEKVEAFNPPMFFPTRGAAVRSFGAACADPKHEFSQFSSDFVLYEIGEFEQADGRLIPYDTPRLVGRGSDYKSLVSEAQNG